MVIAETIVWIASIYVAVGLAFAAAFVAFGVSRVDPAASGTSWAFRLLLVPGCAALWPILARLWLRRPGGDAS
jgi:hypothetical protein